MSFNGHLEAFGGIPKAFQLAFKGLSKAFECLNMPFEGL